MNKEELNRLANTVEGKPKTQENNNWDYELQRRYGYEFRYWDEYKPWRYGDKK